MAPCRPGGQPPGGRRPFFFFFFGQKTQQPAAPSTTEPPPTGEGVDGTGRHREFEHPLSELSCEPGSTFHRRAALHRIEAGPAKPMPR